MEIFQNVVGYFDWGADLICWLQSPSYLDGFFPRFLDVSDFRDSSFEVGFGFFKGFDVEVLCPFADFFSRDVAPEFAVIERQRQRHQIHGLDRVLAGERGVPI